MRFSLRCAHIHITGIEGTLRRIWNWWTSCPLRTFRNQQLTYFQSNKWSKSTPRNQKTRNSGIGGSTPSQPEALGSIISRWRDLRFESIIFSNQKPTFLKIAAFKMAREDTLKSRCGTRSGVVPMPRSLVTSSEPQGRFFCISTQGLESNGFTHKK